MSIFINEKIKSEYEKYGSGLLLGRISSVFKGLYHILNNDKELIGKVSGKFMFHALSECDYPAVGDYVTFSHTGKVDDNAVIHKVIDRYSELSRLSTGGTSQKQVLAANVDIVFICMSLNNDYNIKKFNELLGLVYGSGAKPIILLTKSDLTNSIDEEINNIKNIDESLLIYSISMYSDENTSLIKELIQNKTAVLIGSSGVGKSTIINSLFGHDINETQGIRESDSQGRHTTTNRELFVVDNGVIIDTPGIRTITSYCVDDIDSHYEDIYELSKKCKFMNCTHKHEPGCAVTEAIENGEISIHRYNEYLKGVKFNKFNQKREKVRIRITKNKTSKMKYKRQKSKYDKY